jgi:NAD(P)H-dependent flavin oxidoreductase YrpB (nitropropane dioxygenase family)
MGVRVSLSRLAAAVANEGGVGTISAALIGGIKSRLSAHDYEIADEEELIAQIHTARKLTAGIIAVNIMVALTNYVPLVQAAARAGADIIFSGAGLPMNLPKLVAGTATRICPIVSSARTAEIICRNWTTKYNYVPDAIVVEGPLAGGHLGFSFKELENRADGPIPRVEDILASVIAVAKDYGARYNRSIPVIVGGGVYDGRDIARMLKLGASGVQMATRFVCTDECDAADAFKHAYVQATEKDITIIHSPVGMPGRALRNQFLDRANKGAVSFACGYRCLKTCVPSKSPYCIGDALINAAEGNLNDGFVFVGANVHRVDRITTVKALMQELADETEANL